MDQRKKRLSILKKSARYESSPTQTFTKSNRRISFSGTKSVKEFIPGDDKATIWGTSYEEEDGNQGSGVSNQDSCTVETSTSLAENSIGMKLRNRKIVPSITTEDKENIAKEITYDTTDVEIFAIAGDSRTFNGTLDVTLNSFEIKKFVKLGHDGRNEKEIGISRECASPAKQSRVEADISQNFDYSFINEEDRKMLLQNRIAKKKYKAITNMENNEPSDFLKELDKLKFEEPTKIEPRHVLSDKNQEDSMNMCLSISPIQSMDLSEVKNNSNSRKTIVFQQGQVIASVETDINRTRIRRTALLNEDLILDTSIMSRTNVDQRKSVNVQTSKEDEMVIDDVNKNFSMDRKQSDVNLKRKTIIFQGDNTLSFEMDHQESAELEPEIQSNSQNRKTIFSPRGEKRQACFDESKTGKKLQIQKPRQTIIFDSSEKLEDDSQSKPIMLANFKRTTQIFGGVDMEVEQNKKINTHLDYIEAKNENQSNVPSRKTIVFPKGEEVESQIQKSRQTIIFDSSEKLDDDSQSKLIMLANSKRTTQIFGGVEMEVEQNKKMNTHLDNIETKNENQSNIPNRKTILFPKGEEVETCSYQDQIINNGSPLQQKPRQILALDKGENIENFNDISDVDMEIDENPVAQSSTEAESKIQSNPVSRKTIIFPEGEWLQSRVDDKSIQNRSRQTMIFDNGEKSDGELTSMQNLPINAKRITQLFKSLDIEVEQNLIEDSLNEGLLRSFSASESLGDEKIRLSEFSKVQQGKRQSVFLTNDCLEMTLNEPFSCAEKTNYTQNLERNKNKKALTHEANPIKMDQISLEPSSKTAKNNEHILMKENRKTIGKKDDISQTETSQCGNVLRNANEKGDPFVSFPLDKENVFDVHPSRNREMTCDIRRNIHDGTLDFKQTDARKTRLFNRGELMAGIDEVVSASHVATIEQSISKNEARKTLIFQDGEPLESCEAEVFSDKIADNIDKSALNMKKFDRLKTKIFNQSELLDISKDEPHIDSDYVSIAKLEASQNRELLNQSGNKAVENHSVFHGIDPQEIKTQQRVSKVGLCDKIISPVRFDGRIDARRTKIFQHGEGVEETNVKNIKTISDDSKDIRKTILFHKDLEESGLAFLEPDNSSRSRSLHMITSSNDEMEIDYLPSNQQQQHLQQASDSTRKTMIFSQELKYNATSQENCNQGTTSSNHTANVGLIEFGNLQGLADVQQNVQRRKTENIQASGSEMLDYTSKHVVNTKGAIPKASNTNPRRKTFVFDDENMEIDSSIDQDSFNHDALSIGTASNGSSSKIMFSLKPVAINDLKSNIKNESNEMQRSCALYSSTSIVPKDSHKNIFQKKLQTQLLENREESQEWKTINKSEIDHNRLNTAKEAIIKENPSTNRKSDIRFERSDVFDKINANLDNKSQRKTTVFRDGEHADLNESKKKQNTTGHNHKRDIIKYPNSKMNSPISEDSFNTKSIDDADPDISIDSSSSPPIVVDLTLKDRNKRKTMIFPGGEAIEEESELITVYKTNNTNEKLPQLMEHIANSRNTSNKNKIIENTVTKLNDKGLIRTENTMRKSVIIEKSPSKQAYLSRSDTEHVEYRPYNESEKPYVNVSIFHATQNDNEMELDEEAPRMEKEPTEISSNHIKNRRTMYLNEDIEATIETSFSSSLTDKDNISNTRGQVSLTKNESEKNVIQSRTNNHSTYDLPHESVNQRKPNTQNESQRHSETNKTSAVHCETFVVNRNKNNCDSEESLTRKTFGNNSSPTSDINPHLLRNLPHNSVYFSRTANFPMAGMESFQATGSSFNFSPNSTAALCNIDPDQITGAGYMKTHKKHSASENTFYKQFKRDFAEITIDTIRESPDQYSKLEADLNQDIEKTYIDLVDTIDTIEDSPEKVDACEASVMILHVTEAKENKADVQSINLAQQRSLLCRKCKNCQRTILNETILNETTLSDFNQVEDEPEVELDFSALERLKGKPNFRQVWNKYQEQRLSDNFNATYEEPLLFPTGPSTEFLLANSEEEFMEGLSKETLSDELTGAVCPTIMPLWFLFETRLKEKSCWDFDDLNLPIGVLECRHRNVKGIRILCKFNAQDLYNESATEFNFKRVYLETCNGYRNPSAVDKALQNEIFIRVPRELTGFCSTSSELFAYLTDLESSFTKSKELVKHLLEETALNHAIFECDESDNCIIRKIMFNDTQSKYGIKIEFRIRVRNLEKICANDILLPPRSYFKDDIRTLPSGLEFVKTFLPNPVQFLK